MDTILGIIKAVFKLFMQILLLGVFAISKLVEGLFSSLNDILNEQLKSKK